MKILLSWLREFVDVPGTAEQIAATMSVRGFAVEGVESLPEYSEAVSADGTVARTPASSADAVIDFEVTANRPDCLSVAGMAREIATAYGLQVRRPVVGGSSLALTSLKSVEQGDIDIVIENKELCPRYAGAVADVKVGPSPDWMQARLRAAGVRPISNIVDITNYVLVELGQPMHAFDYAKLGGGKIRVRTARPGETLRTLDGQMRTLTPDMLVIADADRPVATAGVMGGADSEVTAETTTIVLESAYFTPLSVRRTSKTLGLKTEASTRFERGTDPRLPVTAMERACALLELIRAGTARGTLVDRYPLRLEPAVLRLRRERIAGLLGTAVPDPDVKRILEGLGFALREADPSTSLGAGGWDVTVPTRRVDVLREVDLIEEVARHYGFDRIPVTFPALTAPPPPMDPRITQARALRTIMTGAGFSEAVTFGFIAEPVALPFAAEGDLVPIANPLSESFAVLRPSVLPGLIAAVAHNRRREQRDVRLFEIGARFSRSRGERRSLALAWTGAVGADHWSGGTRAIDFFDVRGVAERVCLALRVDTQLEGVAEPWLVPGRGAAMVADGKRGDARRIGVLGLLASSIVEQHDLSAHDAVYVAEFDLDTVPPADEDVRVETLPRHPSVTRDVSILVADTLTAGSVRHTIQAHAPDTLVRVAEFDRYQGKGIPEGQVSLSLRLTFRAPDRTLTDEEVQRAMEAVLAALKDLHAAVQR
jgi:phenylalanyl-tRNA synthetase beta chain